MPASFLGEILAATGIAAILLGLGYVALRHPVVFVAMLVVAWIPASAITESISLSLSLSGFKVSALDVLVAIMAVTAIVRLLSHGARNLACGLALILLLLLVIHIARGVPDFGPQTAVNSARSTFYFVSALAFAATVPGGWGKGVWKVIVAAGMALSLVAVPFWLSRGLGSSESMVIHNGELVTARPLVAAGAIVIVQAAILALAIRWPSAGSAPYVAIACAGGVLLLQHRTVWVAGLVAAIIGFFAWATRTDRHGDRLVLATVGVLLLLLPLAGWAFTRSDPLVRSAKEVTYGKSTLTWRETGWRELLDSHHSPSALAIGEPSGTSYNRRIYSTEVDASAHNGYLETYLRFGIPGLLILLWLGVLLWLRRRRISAATGLDTRTISLLLLTQALFSFTFSLDAVQGIISGVLIAGLGVAGARREPAVALDSAVALGARPA
jgi:hypothetical protein